MQDLRSICRKCGGKLELDSANHMLICPYCGNKEILESDDSHRIDHQHMQQELQGFENTLAATRTNNSYTNKWIIQGFNILMCCLGFILALGSTYNGNRQEFASGICALMQGIFFLMAIIFYSLSRRRNFRKPMQIFEGLGILSIMIIITFYSH